MQRTKRVIPVSISMPPALARRIRIRAAQEDKSRSQFVCEVLERALPPEDAHTQESRAGGGDCEGVNGE